MNAVIDLGQIWVKDYLMMIPVGYMAKVVSARPDFIKANVTDIFSVSSCVSHSFADYINFWKHNGYWLFDSPEAIADVASVNKIDLSGTRMFFYEAYELQYDEEDRKWSKFLPEPSFRTNVKLPAKKILEGFDVVCFLNGNAPECSPLSCNGIADEVPVNSHCLFSTIEDAKSFLESDRDKGEPGPFRIFAVYSL